MSKLRFQNSITSSTPISYSQLRSTEEVNELTEPTVPSTDMPREPEDVLNSHQVRTGTAKKAPDPYAVAQFREGLENTKTSTATNKLPVSVSTILTRLLS